MDIASIHHATSPISSSSFFLLPAREKNIGEIEKQTTNHTLKAVACKWLHTLDNVNWTMWMLEFGDTVLVLTLISFDKFYLCVMFKMRIIQTELKEACQCSAIWVVNTIAPHSVKMLHIRYNIIKSEKKRSFMDLFPFSKSRFNRFIDGMHWELFNTLASSYTSSNRSEN